MNPENARAKLLHCLDQARAHLADPIHDVAIIARQMIYTGELVVREIAETPVNQASGPSWLMEAEARE